MPTYCFYLRDRISREILARGSLTKQKVEATTVCRDGFQVRPSLVYEDTLYSYVISGRQEFEAKDDLAALAIARLIWVSSADICELFELWEGTRQIDQRKDQAKLATAICARSQDSVICTEEALLNSRWAVAHSQSLLTRFNELRSDGAGHSKRG
jgi:hypothetical protein